MQIKILQKKYPKFVYESFEYKTANNDLEIIFSFVLRSFMRRRIFSDIKFQPKIIIENIDKQKLASIKKSVLNNLIFHLGLIEIPSYWKTTCSPEIEIQAGYLKKKQINWWKKLIIDGLGQFYYENKIDWRIKNFLKITSSRKKIGQPYLEKLKDRYLVPFAGGRDSIVTLEELKKAGAEISLFTINPIEKIQKTVEVSGVKKQIIIRRIIDKKLLELNKKGFLNGHTPFTSVLSFISLLCAVLFDYKNIAFSNEKSSNEGNVKYLGKTINHQWAKSSAFEKMFSDYAKEYLAKEINYFSYIRKYGELEISQMLAKYPQYFPVFSSCNAGMKIAKESSASAKSYGETRWCGNCPKCLFVYLSLYPFLTEKDRLLIFGQDIFENKNLLPVMKNLLGKNNTKPFECVGTKQETQKAFDLCFKKAKKFGKIPFLLTKI
jgi:UDP-N-acetyl-alpha-D-muramoyl-L-alanyl-L-glutamate epimerase